MTLFNIKSLISISAVLLVAIVDAEDALNLAGARQCYSCEGINCLRSSKVNVTTSCTDQLDYCVSIFQNSNVVSRGCYADLTAVQRQKCDNAQSPDCVKCFGQLCNNKARSNNKCIMCTAREHNGCAENASAMTPQQCPIPTALNTYCYVRDTLAEGVTRGCAVHQPEQLECLNNPNCALCLSADAEACNSYRVLAQATAAGGTIAPMTHQTWLTLHVLALLLGTLWR